MLRCKTNTILVKDSVWLDFKWSANYNDAYGTPDYQIDFEHGRWWVTEKPAGRQWSVHDASHDRFDFELVSEGEDA